MAKDDIDIYNEDVKGKREALAKKLSAGTSPVTQKSIEDSQPTDWAGILKTIGEAFGVGGSSKGLPGNK
jgi:hypothetical protein